MTEAPRNNRHNHMTRDIKLLGQCPSCDEYYNSHKIKEIKSLMQKHDWFYEYADGQNEWRKGSDEKAHIISLMRKIPMYQIPELFELVPSELKAKWLLDLQRPERGE